MSLSDTQFEFVQDVIKLLTYAISKGYKVTFGEVQRPLEMQQLYVKTGRSKTMDSQHLKRLAIDLNLFLNNNLCTREQIEPIGKFWEALNPKNRWGGSWRGLIEAGKSTFVDAPHFERQE